MRRKASKLYDTEVVEIPDKEDEKATRRALKKIALENILDCEYYDGDEEKYMEFINAIKGLRQEWKAFRRTNVENFNYYIAKAKFFLKNYSRDYRDLYIDEFKDYERLLHKQDPEFYLKMTDAQKKHFEARIKYLDNLQGYTREEQEYIYKYRARKLKRRISFDEYMFRLEGVRILNAAGSIVELQEFVDLIQFKYFLNCSVQETSDLFAQLGKYKETKTENANKRGSTNNELRKLEKAFAQVLIDRERNYIKGKEFYNIRSQALKSLNIKDKLIHLGKLIKENEKQLSETRKLQKTLAGFMKKKK